MLMPMESKHHEKSPYTKLKVEVVFFFFFFPFSILLYFFCISRGRFLKYKSQNRQLGFKPKICSQKDTVVFLDSDFFFYNIHDRYCIFIEI